MDELFEYDNENLAFDRAVKAVETGESLFLTGKAGTGKTTFLKYIKENSKRKVAVLAPTGIAAINAGGQTIHSFFKLEFGPLLPDDVQFHEATLIKKLRYNKKQISLIREIDTLVIDEVSMVRADLLDMIDKVMRTVRNNDFLPFGGVQVLLIGDPFQLPPVTNKEEWELLRRWYKCPFFFSSMAFKSLNPVCVELEKIYRQKDSRFIEVLNSVRENKITTTDLKILNDRVGLKEVKDQNYITISTHNYIVDTINEEKLKLLENNSFHYNAEIFKDFPIKSAPTDIQLELKVGAQVMFIKNEIGELKRFYNGSIGEVVKLTDDEIYVRVSSGEEIKVEYYLWENIKYEWNATKKEVNRKVTGGFKQYPLRLAWAITVHKSQGLTFEYVKADLSKSFSEGQVYVALSRCKSLEGLVLSSPIKRSVIRTNGYVVKFSNWIKGRWLSD